MTKKGLEVLKAVHRSYPALIECVVGARDEALEEDCYEEIKGICATNNIQFFDRAAFGEVTTTYALAISWRWMIVAQERRLIVFHDSLIPRYRGFGPLVTALINGDEELGVTAMFAASEYDRGDVVDVERMPVIYPIKIQQVIEGISGCYERIVIRILGKLLRDRALDAAPQKEEDATYSLWRDEKDYFIDWRGSSSVISRFIDAVGFPYKGARAYMDNQVVVLRDVRPVPDVVVENRTPGKVIFMRDGFPTVVCGEGLLEILAMEDEGGVSILPMRKFRVRFS